ncbi:MAG: hypothetical protein GXO07_06760 [Crenarchaeota archaeon]|nr:hypothetical protein [Thermoproteota archaeon]
MNELLIADAYRVGVALLTLLYASYLDLKTREIPPKLWLIASLLALPATLYEAHYFAARGALGYVVAVVVSSAIIIGILAFMSWKGLIGGADVLALAFLTVSVPWYPFSFGLRAFVPVPLLTLFYATILGVLWLPIRALSNLRSEKFLSHARELGLGGAKLLRLAASAKVVTVKEYMNMKFWYPLEIFKEKGEELEHELRTTFSVEEEHEDHQKRMKELVERGLLSEDRYIFVSYGVPFLVYITLGFVLALAIGDIPLRALFAW